MLKGIGGYVETPLVDLQLNCPLKKGKVKVGVVETLPMSGVDFLLGNDIAGGEVRKQPIMS